MALVVAVSDVHSPRYLRDYVAALARRRSECSSAGLVLWGGDMVNRGSVPHLRPVIDVTKRFCSEARIYAVFGNEEYIGLEEKFRRLYPEVAWLDDNSAIVELEGLRIGIYGTRGSLDRPTAWQRKNMPWIWRTYRERPKKLVEEVRRLREKGPDVVVVLMHYAPTYRTLEGEPSFAWPEMGSRLMERALAEARPDMVLHGHAHRSKRLEASIDGVKVVNIALPARGDVYVFDAAMLASRKPS